MGVWTSRRSRRLRFGLSIGVTAIAVLGGSASFAADAVGGKEKSQATTSDAPQLRFSLHAEPVATVDIAALRRIGTPRRIRVFEPYEGREVTFEALAFDAVLEQVLQFGGWNTGPLVEDAQTGLSIGVGK